MKNHTNQTPVTTLAASWNARRALTWRIAHRSATDAAALILGREDGALADVASAAAGRVVQEAFQVLTVNDHPGVERLARVVARRMAIDELRRRRGRARGAEHRRIDPLSRADTQPLENLVPVAADGDPEATLLADEESRRRALLLRSAGLTASQRAAIRSRLNGESPMSAADRQALRAAIRRLRAIALAA